MNYEEIEKQIKEIAEWMKKNCSPHDTIVITSDRFDLLQGITGKPIESDKK